MSDDITIQCYNRGCGQKYNPNDNKQDSCVHHPGEPFFHDAYKGWTCCQKKCIDFTEFLDIKGCTISQHSNIKPPEPEKPNENVPNKEIEVKPIIACTLERPPLNSPLVTLKPDIASSLQQQLSNIEESTNKNESPSDEIAVGTTCKNKGCSSVYQGPDSCKRFCLYHPGVPVFHEGLKFWTCCQRKTTDFNNFLNQEGCKEGSHVWIKEDNDNSKVQCRWDYHQTGPYMVVSIYAKEYSPSKSVIKLNPIRLYANLVFPKRNNANFELDVELKGIVNLDESKVTMYGTKVEVKLKKAEAGVWTKLGSNVVNAPVVSPTPQSPPEVLSSKIEAVDLADL